jgi:hypothetical protein
MILVLSCWAENAVNVSGTVLDPSGAAIPNAKIVIKNTSGQVVAQVTTNVTGAFDFSSHESGKYLLTATHDGFRASEISIDVSPKRSARLRVVLAIASTKNEVTVTAEANNVTSEVANNQNILEVTQNTLDSLPVMDQDYIALLSQFLDPAATGTNGVSLVVNGVEANGPGVTASAIKSVKMNNNPYSALFSRPGRARLEIETKSGTPDYHGTVNFLFRDSVFDARNAYAATKPNEQRRFWEGSLTGPVGHSHKTTFLTALNYDEKNDEAVVVAQTPDGAINANVPQPLHHFFGSGRIFHQFSEASQFWIGYSYERNTTENLVGIQIIAKVRGRLTPQG